VTKKKDCFEQVFVFENGDAGEDGGEEGGEQRERILAFFFPSFFFSFPLGACGGEERTGAVS
jgi:hypothetical protein